MTTNNDFQGFPKMGRLSREAIITEKIDGTNAQILITPEGEMLVGSRTRWITPEQDNHGFARWCAENKEELLKLGPGRHFDEWWGSGINRGYGLAKGEKRLSLFNVMRWCLHGTEPQVIPSADPRIVKYQQELPACVGLVPILHRGIFSTSLAPSSPRVFLNPEGIVVFHVAGNVGFKKTLGDDGAKGA